MAASAVDMTEEPANITFPSLSYPFRSNETFIARNSLFYCPNGTVSMFFGGRDLTNITCGVRRVMIVTISNLMNAPPKTSDTNDQLAYEIRQLQDKPL